MCYTTSPREDESLFDRVAVIGCGIMGSGIAQILATTESAVTV